MDELSRLNYLEAIGLEQWVPRKPLLNARASEYTEPSDLAHLESAETPSLEQLSSIPETAETVQPAQASEVEYSALDAVSQVSVNAIVTSDLESTSDESTPVQESAEVAPALETKINLEIYGRDSNYALLVEKEQSNPLSQSETSLLNNIIKSIDKLSESAQNESHGKKPNNFREVFTWPMFENPVEPDAIKGRQAMCDALNAFVSASIKRHQHNTLLILGDQLELLLDQKFLGENIKILFAPSLGKILNTPEHKMKTWKLLLQTFKA